MQFYINPTTQMYYQYDDNHDFKKYPRPYGLVSCPVRPDFGVWIDGGWTIDTQAQHNALLTAQLRAIDSAVTSALKKQHFDNQAQLQQYAANNPDQYGTLNEWVYKINLFWDDVQSGSVAFATVQDCINSIPKIGL